MPNLSRETALPSTYELAAAIVNSKPVLGVFAACEWDELSDDGKLWIAEIVAEAGRRFAEIPAPRKETGSNIKPAPFALTPGLVGRAIEAAGSKHRPLPMLVPEQRRQVLCQAIAHLKARCILVDVVSRDADIRTYRVSGKRDAMLADEVIAFARLKGFEVQS